MLRALAFLTVLSFAALAWAAEANPWPEFKQPFEGPPRAIGDYSKGCLQGGTKLDMNGEGYQVMRPGRRRFFGHPTLVSFVQDLAKGLHEKTGGMLMIGDLSQARGGRSNGGHSSHQTGLDVDIWYWNPKVAEKAPLSRAQREQISARSVVVEKRGVIAPAEKDKVTAALQIAATDPRVARIFVHPVIKRELCSTAKTAGEDTGWLAKVRPWHGHDDHFHVRLNCPAESPQCQAQEPVPAGDGCNALGFWFDKKAQAERKKAQKSYQKNVDEGRGWPDACEPLLR